MSDTDDRPRPHAAEASKPPVALPASLENIAKAIRDLDLLLRALLTSLPGGKPWQRQLRLHLQDADRMLQVLRMTVAMDRPDADVLQAARELVIPLRAANVYVGSGRADGATKQAVQLGFNLAQHAVAGLETANQRA